MIHKGFCLLERGGVFCPMCDETIIQENEMTYQRNETPEPMAAGPVIGGRYNWKYGERVPLIYLGLCEPRNGHWHQFAKVEAPNEVWCEVLTSDLYMIEETKAPHV